MTLQDETTFAEADQADDDSSGIPLPEVTRRTSARRIRAERRRQRRRTAFKAVGLATAAVALLTVAVKAWPSGDKSGGDNDTAGKNTAPAPAALPSVLLAQQDAASNASGLTLLVPGAKAKGGALVLIPPGTMTEVVSVGLEPVGKSLGLGGAQRLDATVENLLGISIGEVLALDEPRLVALVQPAGPLSIRVPERVEQVDARGSVTVLWEAGLHKIEPADVPRFLAAKAQSNDLARLARHQAFWDAFLARLRANKAAIPKEPPGLNKALTALVNGGPDDLSTRVLPVASLGASNEDGELYQADPDQVRELVGNLVPGQKAGAPARPRLQILNGTGAVGLAQKVADKLGAQGVEVKLTGNAGRLDHAETQVVFYRREDEAAAQRIQKALGVGRVVMSRNPIDVIDITIIVGRDFTA